MSLTKEELQRGAAIMQHMLKDFDEDLGNYELLDDLLAVQQMCDVISSPLFSALVDIKDQCKKSVEATEQWNAVAEVKGSDQPEVVAQFRQRYSIVGPPHNGTETAAAGTGTLSLPPTHTTDDLIDDITLPTDRQCTQQSHDGSSSHTPWSHDLLGQVDPESPMLRLKSQTLTAEFVGSRDLNRTPSIGSNDSFGSTGKGGKRRKKKTASGVSLSHLVRAPQNGISLKSLRPNEGDLVRSECKESSLSSLSSEASTLPPPPPPPPPFPPAYAISTADTEEAVVKSDDVGKERDKRSSEDATSCVGGADRRDNIIGIVGGADRSDTTSQSAIGSGDSTAANTGKKSVPKDILFFMRDKKSMTNLRTTLNGKWGRGPREVILPCVQDPDEIGIGLCGLASTGTYVESLREFKVGGMHKEEGSMVSELQVGDKILAINGQNAENLAWFEVAYLMKSPGRTKSETEEEEKKLGRKRRDFGENEQYCSLMVQFNPTGFAEAQRSLV